MEKEKQVYINLKTPQEIKETAIKKAAKKGMGLSAYIRYLIMKDR